MGQGPLTHNEFQLTETDSMEVAVIKVSAPEIRPDLPSNLSSLRVGDRRKLFKQRERSRDIITREVQDQAGRLRRSASGSAAEKSGLESIARFFHFGQTIEIEVRWSLRSSDGEEGPTVDIKVVESVQYTGVVVAVETVSRNTA